MQSIDDLAWRPISGYEHRCLETDEGRLIRDLLKRIGDKWSLLVIGTLSSRTMRFSHVQRHIPGISQRMLTQTLRNLERDGLVLRTLHPEVPPRVEYTLTDMGRTLIAPAAALANWAIANQAATAAARAAFDVRANLT